MSHRERGLQGPTADGRTSANPSLAEIKAAVPPASGLKKGETPQQYVARTIDLDLGDF